MRTRVLLVVGETEAFGKGLAKLRKQRGYTQQQLAELTNTSTKFISNVENGKKSVHLDKVLLLVRFLGAGIGLIALEHDGETNEAEEQPQGNVSRKSPDRVVG